ncbi:MAG: PKD domain-containing protein [Sphingobacteriales bacterium JAD_PAG50586_3]|nr:MAG: PKD domain-containing protein [Sphingobacteriales bacterium JAD_PAG50586_3]
MKKIFTLLAAIITANVAFGQAVATLSGEITANRTLNNDTIYFLDGFVYVKNGATITIEPGTIIKGVSGERSTLIITRGSKINAAGTKNQPIVFTSDKVAGDRNPGDWGGIVLLGKARINRSADCTTCPGAAIAANEAGIQTNIEGDLDNANGDGLYGGNDDTDNSGTMTYVRIEYAGVVINTGNEINGFTLGAVGSGTTINNIQVSYANDDSFEWFGGTVSAKNLISLGAIDDDFDTDFGFTGKIQFAVAQRDSNNYDTGSGPTTNGFESDNDGGPTFNNPRTAPVFSNVTLVGPLANGVALQQSNSFQNAARLRRNTLTSVFNSVFMGFPTGILVDGAGSTAAYLGDTLRLKNNISAGATVSDIRSTVGASDVLVKTKFEGPDACDTLDATAGILTAPFNYGNPNFLPAANSPALTGGSFTDSYVSGNFFTPTTFRGAFGTINGTVYQWDECWAKYNPQNENYTTPGINYLDVVAGFSTNAVLNVADFTNSSTNATAYAWDFGDGQTSTEAFPSHTYPNQNGTYQGNFNCLPTMRYRYCYQHCTNYCYWC